MCISNLSWAQEKAAGVPVIESAQSHTPVATAPSSSPPALAGEEGGGRGGEGEMRTGEEEEQEEGGGGGKPPEEVVLQSVLEPAPLKEEPKGPRPIASVSVPGMLVSTFQVCMCVQ